MSKWLVTLKWIKTENKYGNVLCSNTDALPCNKIVQFKGDLPAEKEIEALQSKTTYDGRKDYYLILFMQKLGESGVNNDNKNQYN